MLIDLREGEGRKRNIDVREKHQSVASHTYPGQGLNRNPGVRPDQELSLRPFH